MNPQAEARLNQLLDAAIDDPAGAERLHAALAEDPELRSAYELHLRIVRRLQGLVAAPETPSCPAGARAPIAMPRSRLPLLAGIAAAVLLATLAGWWFFSSPSRVPEDPTRRLAAIHARAKLGGMQPRWKCENDEEFAATTRDRLGQALLVTPRDGLILLGWDYDYLFSDQTCVLLVKSDNDDVVIAMDHAAMERPIDPAKLPGIGVHRRVIGGIVLYELSGSPTPLVLDRFYNPAD